MSDVRSSTPDATGDHPMMALLDAYDGRGQFERGDVVTGVVALVNDNEILIDVGAKSEGILAAREFADMSRDERQAFKPGDSVECMVVNTEDRAGHLVLSLSQAKQGLDWERAQELFESDNAFEEVVSGHNKGGLIVHLGSVRGFIPISQIDRAHAVDRSLIDGSTDSPLATMVGKEIVVKVIEIDRRKNRLILSEQAAMREQRRKRKAELLDQLQEGQVVQGVVTSLADFGAFVDIGGADGLVHLSELSWQRVTHPREVVHLGDNVTVKVISVDRDRKRIGLSMKQLEPEPWSDLEERFQVGTVVKGEITRITDFGAFARVDGDVEGLIHVSELSDEAFPPEEVVSPGDSVELRVIRIEPDKKRLGLSLKRAGADYDDFREEPDADIEVPVAAEEDGAAMSEPEMAEPEMAEPEMAEPEGEADEPEADGAPEAESLGDGDDEVAVAAADDEE